MECNSCTRDMAFKGIRDAVEAGKYTGIYEQPGGDAVSKIENIRLEDKEAMMELLSDEESLDYSQRKDDDIVSFISKDTDGDISYAVAFEYNFKTGKVTIRLTADLPNPDEDKLILEDFRN